MLFKLWRTLYYFLTHCGVRLGAIWINMVSIWNQFETDLEHVGSIWGQSGVNCTHWCVRSTHDASRVLMMHHEYSWCIMSTPDASMSTIDSRLSPDWSHMLQVGLKLIPNWYHIYSNCSQTDTTMCKKIVQCSPQLEQHWAQTFQTLTPYSRVLLANLEK